MKTVGCAISTNGLTKAKFFLPGGTGRGLSPGARGTHMRVMSGMRHGMHCETTLFYPRVFVNAMQSQNPTVHVFKSHWEAEHAVQSLSNSGFDVTELSIVGGCESGRRR